MIKTDKFGKKKVLQFYLFCIFQHFDCENKLLLWNCLEFKFCGFLDNCIRKYFSFLSDSLNHKCYFFIFLFFLLFKYVCYYFFIFWTKCISWKMITSISDWCIIHSHFVSFEKIIDQNPTIIQMSPK